MASENPFDLLIDDDSGDTTALLAAVELKIAAANAAENGVATKPPSKPLPPTQPASESKNDGGRGRGGREDRGYVRGGRGGGGFNRNRENSGPNENGFSLESTVKPYEKRNGFDDGHSRGGRRGGFNNGEADGERPRRNYERRSGTGRGSEIKRDGAGRGNWGTTNDDIAPEVEETVTEIEVNVSDEKAADEEEKVDAEKENEVKEPEEKEPEEKQMTLDEYQKVLEEKRKALLALREEKGEERKVDVKEFQAMHLVSKKKVDDEVFIKLGSEKDKKREAAEKEEKAKKSVSINEFLKPADGEGYYRSGGRGRGRGRDNRGSGGQYNGGGYPRNNVRAPKIEDEGQFPTLGGK